MLKLNSICKSFGEKQVFKNFSAEIPDSSQILITGPSGAGKTTLLRIIAGLDSADSGKVTFSEHAEISFMFQEPRLFPWMSAIENVNVVLPKIDLNKTFSILNELGLGEEINSMPSELSGGMQRRVALARALLYPADIYLFDEPFAGLDPENAELSARVMLNRTCGKTSLIVSHDRSMLNSDIDTLQIVKLS